MSVHAMESERPDMKGDGWDDEPLMKAGEVAKALGVHRNTVYELPIPRVRVCRGAIRWRPEDVKAFIELRTEAA